MNEILVAHLREQIVTAGNEGRRLIACAGKSKLIADGFEGSIFMRLEPKPDILHYDPREFTITVSATTPIESLRHTLEEHDQYLPFDPMFANEGATIGGTVASASNGSCCLRFGSVRDFILGICFLDGNGNQVRAGGNVVKNAAGFDLPKFFVGSQGRFGVLTEICLKVFPKPRVFSTVCVDPVDKSDWRKWLMSLNRLGVELDAVDIDPAGSIAIRFGGSEDVLDEIESQIKTLTASTDNCKSIRGPEEESYWQGISHANWADRRFPLVKIPISVLEIESWNEWAHQESLRHRFISAGHAMLLELPDEKTGRLKQKLAEQNSKAQFIRQDIDGCWNLGSPNEMPFLQRVKKALDPKLVFGKLEA